MKPTFSTVFLANLVSWTLAAPASYNATSTPTVSLPYARYQGFHNETSGLDVFLGIRYAQAPVGDLRWRAPKAPLPVTKTLQATSQPAKCFQLNLLGDSGSTPGVPDPTEDCLFLNVFAPPLSTRKKKLPVLVWIHGGGYFAGFAASFDPTLMLQASNNSFVAVIIQYRLGMFGFLPGSEVKKNGALNAGLLDMQFALKWTQQNIHLFGGDPNQVTIWGESAGAGGVMMQVVANGGKTNPPLFKRAIASSTYVPPNYKYNDPQAELQYTSLVKNTGCTNSTDTLACLRSLDYATLAAGATQVPRPVVDGKFLTQRPQLSLARKQVNGVRASIYRHNVDEGRIFVTQNVNSTVQPWITAQLPDLSPQNITAVENAYQVFASSNASEADNIYKIQTFIFGEAEFVCPSLWLVDAFPKNGYQGLFAVAPSLHSLDLNVYFPGQVLVLRIHTVLALISFVGALVSFILTGTPNNNPMNKTINPNWPTYDSKNPQGMTFNVTSAGAADTKFEAVNSALRQRCK
ncbi:carboxylesterase [Rhizoctonia solani 123E]|uniref:Carboxylic ester hydrolase n=1 Tax=Rhizoctonia solani 123E TaxID=1423351 RepID=A0A074SX33_9AGAM|nr:carboxylesterase [Rhizoctonia solani 123E]